MQNMFFENYNHASSDFPFLQVTERRTRALPHFHTELEIFYLAHGAVDVIFLGQTQRLRAGDLCLFMPGQIHGFHADGICKEYVIKIDPANSHDHPDLANMRSASPILHPGTPLHTSLVQHLLAAAHAAEEKPLGYAYLVNSISNLILYDILQSGILQPLGAELGERHIKRLSLLQNVNDHILQQDMRDITLESVAASCGYSVSYFAHFFKSVAQCTFMQYLTRMRLHRAVELLRSAPDAKLSEIAEDCGFPDARAFSRAFYQHHGMTPSAFRAQIK